MALRKIKDELWFKEDLFPDVAQEIKISKILFRKTTKNKKAEILQELLIANTPRFGKMMAIDGAIQFTQADEKYYHEPFAHCTLFSHKNPKNVLIIGGGDGGILREVVKHPVRAIDLAEIDKTVIDMTKKYVPELAGNSWNDARLNIIIDDGAEFVRTASKKYDVILVDSPDPVGVAKSLFQKEFYLNCKKVLAPGGIVMRQTGTAVLQLEEMPMNFRHMQKLFSEVKVFLTAVATYAGGYFSFVAASNKKGTFDVALPLLKKRFNKMKIQTNWYTPEMHQASMVLPRDLARSIKL